MSSKHVFISYVREDLPYVSAMAKALEKSGLQVWYDKSPGTGINPGGEWKNEIQSAIDESYAFLLCISGNLVKRIQSGVYPEALLAVNRSKLFKPGTKYIFPVRFDDSPIPKVEIGQQKYLDEIQSTDLFGTREERNGNFCRLVKSIRESPNCPTGTRSTTSDAHGIPGQLEYVLAEVLGRLMETRNLLKLAALAVGLFVAIYAVGPVLQIAVDTLGSDTDMTGIGAKIAAIGWFIVALGMVFWPRGMVPDAPNNVPINASISGNRWELKAHKIAGEKLRAQARYSATFWILWGSILTSAWWFVCAFGTPLATSSFWKPVESDPWLFFVPDTLLALMGVFVLTFFAVRKFSAAHLHNLFDRLKIAFGIAFVPGMIWFLLLTPQALTVLGDRANFPIIDKNFETNYVVFQFAQRVLSIPVALLAAFLASSAKKLPTRNSRTNPARRPQGAQ